MKNFKKIAIIVIILFISNSTLVYGNEEIPWRCKKDCNFINSMYKINKKCIKEESEFYKASIEYPYLQIKNYKKRENEDAIKVIEGINSEIYDFIYNIKETTEEESKRYKEEYENEFVKYGYIKYQYENYIGYKVTYNKNNILSIPIESYEFTGGAHGLTDLEPFNYCLESGNRLTLKDLFKEGVNYKKIINSYVFEDMKANPDKYFKGDNVFCTIDDNQSFYLDKNNLVVYFSLYEIAPYSSGIPEFYIPYEDIEPYLNINTL